MTTANKITIFRILLVPFFFFQLLSYIEDGVEIHRWLAITTFAVAALSDGLDGYIARRFNQRSELGAVLDPLADKLLLVSAIVLLSFSHAPNSARLPYHLLATVVSRDVIILLGVGVIHYTCGKVIVRPCLVGKVATVLQIVVVVWALLKLNVEWLVWWALATSVCTGISGVSYVMDGMQQLSASPKSLATPDMRQKD